MMIGSNYWSRANWIDGFGFFLIPLLLWSLFWKGWALWRAAKNDSLPWFVVLLLVNTLGVLDIVYIFIFGKERKKAKK